MIKATIIKIGNGYEVTGLTPVSNGKYEMKYLFTFGAKVYKTPANAKRAIERKGFEYVETTSEQLVCGYN